MLGKFGAHARRLVVGAVAAAVGFGAAIVVPTAAAPPSFAAEGCLANPMGAATPIGSENGYTLFVTGDAVLANSELEGTLAVGGVATFGDPRGQGGNQYPVFHGGVGGNAAYTVPTIDGADNRVLMNEFASSKVVQIQNRGGSPTAGAKLLDRTAPTGYTFGPQFGGAGTTYFPADGSNMSPQLESAVQPWDDGAGAATFVPEKSAFAEYFDVDRGAEILANVPEWKTPTLVPGGEARLTLDAGGPNRLELADLAGTSKFQLTGYAPESPLIIAVSPEDVVDGRLSLPSYAGAGKEVPGAGEGISYILWDLSALSGDVVVTSPNEPVRGSIYAPSAHVIFPPEADGGREFEGQLIAAEFTALQGGKEMHTNLFQGVFACDVAESVGGFSLSKALSLPQDVDPALFDELTFTVSAEWTIAGETKSETFELTARGPAVEGPQDLPAGTIVTFSEASPPTVPGLAFDDVEFSPQRLIVVGGVNALVTATNTYVSMDAAVGGFSVRKSLAGVEAAAFPSGTTFDVVATWRDGDVEHTRTLSLPADGTEVTGPQDIPAGTTVTFSEPVVPSVEGYAFEHVAFSPAEVVVGAGVDASVTATNTYRQVEAPVGGFSMRKMVTGTGAERVPSDATFAVDYFLDGAPEPAGRLTLPVSGEVVVGPQYLPVGTVVTFEEVAPADEIAGAFWDGAPTFSPAQIIVEPNTNADVVLTNTITEIPDLPLTDGDGDGEVGLPITGSTPSWGVTAFAAVMVLGGTVTILTARRLRRPSSR